MLLDVRLSGMIMGIVRGLGATILKNEREWLKKHKGWL